MPISPLAGKPAPKQLLVDVALLEREVLRGAGSTCETPASWSASAPADTGAHHCAALHRSAHPGDHPSDLRLPSVQGTDGPLYMGKDTHALSGPAHRTALEVLAANGVRDHHPAG